jgi:hypothetical protein
MEKNPMKIFTAIMQTRYLHPQLTKMRSAVLALLCMALSGTSVSAQGVFQFSQFGSLKPAQGWQFVSGSFTQSGRTDVMAYSPATGALMVGKNTGSNFQFSQWGSVVPAAGWSFVAGDFNGDDALDVMGYNSADGTLWVGANTGTAFNFSKWATIGPASGWSFVAGDFTGDGLVDVMGYYSGNGTLWVGQNTGSGFSFSLWATVGPAAGWAFAAGDFNRDGRIDVMGYFGGNGTVWVGANTGSSFAFGLWASIFPDNGWNFLPGSFSGDGNADLIGYHSQDGTFQLVRNAATNFYVNPTPWATKAPAMGGQFVAGNFTNSGRLDVLGYSPNDGSFWVGRNTGLPPEGYAWPLSAMPGQTIDFHVSGVANPAVTFFRHTTNSQGAVVSTPMGSATFVPEVHSLHAQAWASDTGWPISFSVTIPGSWPSGMYSARLTSATGAYSYITFVVRPDPATPSTIAVIANVNTWDAYNEWGGRGKYDGAAYTTFLRPNPAASPIGEGFMQHHLARAQLWVYGWLEQQGYHPDLYTDIDFHNGIPLVQNGKPTYKKLIVDTHPEYWTTQEYYDLQNFENSGGSLLYLGGNGIYESCSYFPDETGVVFYNGVENGDRNNTLFRTIGLPEINLLGIAYLQSGVLDTAYAVTDASSQVYGGTLQNGDLIGTSGLNTGGINTEFQGYAIILKGRAAGWEIDSTTGIPGVSPPPGVDVVAQASNVGGGAQMVFWTTPAGGHVLSTGSITFGGSLVKDPNLQRIVLNVLKLP